MASDEALMKEFQQGSRAALEELFERYREPLYGFFRRRLDNRPPGPLRLSVVAPAVAVGAAAVLPATERAIFVGWGCSASW